MATEEYKIDGQHLLSRGKEIVHEGNVRRIIIKNEAGHSLLEIPLSIGVVGAVLRGVQETKALPCPSSDVDVSRPDMPMSPRSMGAPQAAPGAATTACTRKVPGADAPQEATASPAALNAKSMPIICK